MAAVGLRSRDETTPATIRQHNAPASRPSLAQPNDSIIALCMALEAMENQPEPVQVIGWL